MTSFLARFVEIARRNASSPAVVEPHRSVSYGELLGLLEHRASALRATGVGPGALLPVVAPRSIEAITAMLAAWGAGAAFLPLDPALPAARREAILAHAQARAVEPDPGPARPFALDLTPDPDALAYVIYTSGSTGKPKGVRVAHRGLWPVLSAQIDAFGLAHGKRSLWLLSPGFDASISDIGVALLSGASLHIPPPGLDPGALLAYLARERVTHADLPPSLLPLLGALPPSLEVVIMGGEVCPIEAVRRHGRGTRLINVYGPTEATICTSLGPCDPATWGAPLLGQPLPGVVYEVLDEQRQPADEGELYIGGVTLALGYLDDAALEAERFVEVRGQRRYRTGDRVRRAPGGEYEFVGRIDRQLKLRGQLVAPEEIEARLREHPAVREAAVVDRPLPRPGRAPRSCLVAFVEAQGDLAGLDQRLRRRLPAALCPRVEPVERLPRNSSGKVDLAALRALPLAAPALPPDTDPVVALLARLFGEILGLPAGPQSHFFDLGGDSLAALELLAAAQTRGLALPADALYRAPTPAALARAAGGVARSTDELRQRVRRPAPPSAPGPRPPAPPGLLLTGATGFFGSWLLAELQRRGDVDEIHTLVRAPSDDEARRRLRAALAAIGASLDEGRVRAWAGDVESPTLGLDPGRLAALSARVGVVIHGAARVHLLEPLETLWSANVEACAHVADFARSGPDKRLHHVSTLSVLVATDLEAIALDERADPRAARLVFGGYAQSKWAAEELLRGALPHACHRLGLLTGDTEHARPSATCQLTRLLAALASLGCVPEGDHEALRVDITPVDHAARAVAALVARPTEGVDTFHIASGAGASLARLLGALEAEGAPVRPVPARAFLDAVERRPTQATSMALLSLPALLGGQRRDSDLFQLTGRELRCEATERATGLPHPAIDDTLLRRYARAALETDR